MDQYCRQTMDTIEVTDDDLVSGRVRLCTFLGTEADEQKEIVKMRERDMCRLCDATDLSQSPIRNEVAVQVHLKACKIVPDSMKARLCMGERLALKGRLSRWKIPDNRAIVYFKAAVQIG